MNGHRAPHSRSLKSALDRAEERLKRHLVAGLSGGRRQSRGSVRVVGLLSGLGKHLDSRVDVVETILPYTRAALDQPTAG